MGFLSRSIGIPNKKLFAITSLNAGILSWYFVFTRNSETLFRYFSTDASWIYLGAVLFYFFAALSAFIGAFLSKRISGKRFLWIWTTFGILVTGLMLIFKGQAFILVFGPLLGVTLGLGFPYSLSLLANCTKTEQRGRVSGILLFETFALAALGIILASASSLGFLGIVIVLMALKATSFLGIATNETDTCIALPSQQERFSRVHIKEINRNFLFYFLPWLLFIVAIVLTDHIIWPTFQSNTSVYNILTNDPWHYVGTAVFGVVSGFMADRIGRKIPIFCGLALLGFSLVLIGSIVNPVTAFIHVLAIGVAFGFLMVIYITIPGDLSEPFSGEKFYALILVLPLAIYGGLGALPRVFGAEASYGALSWVLTSLIFASVIPVYLARDTLRDEKIRERRIKEYVEKLSKLVDEYKKTEN